MDKSKALKRTVKYLSMSKDPQINRLIIRRCPDGVFKALSNAALNAARGQVKLQSRQKKLFAKHRNWFTRMCDVRVPIKTKRMITLQSGNGLFAAIIPILLSAIFSTIGTQFLPGRK